MRKKFLALSLAVIVSAAQVMTVSASKQEQLQQQQAAQAEPSVHSHNSICIDPARKAHRRQGLKSPLRRISHRVPGTDPL